VFPETLVGSCLHPFVATCVVLEQLFHVGDSILPVALQNCSEVFIFHFRGNRLILYEEVQDRNSSGGIYRCPFSNTIMKPITNDVSCH
jgi:hypothetical protein